VWFAESADRAERGVIEEDAVDLLITFTERRTIIRLKLPTFRHQLVTVSITIEISLKS